jgi:hypothetical protein
MSETCLKCCFAVLAVDTCPSRIELRICDEVDV